MAHAVESPITAVVCTRNRGAAAADAVRSLLASTHPAFTLLVVDQSDADDTEQALRSFCADSRLRYIRSATVGVSRARNLGLRLADTEVVAFTDDDCTVPPDWLSRMASVFAENPLVAVAFCNVAASEHDPTQGFIPAYVRADDLLVTNIREKPKARGIGAGMAMRRETVLAFGGFDEALGPGGRFRSCEEGDLVCRALLFGHTVFETARTQVVHAGFRTYAEGRELSRRDWLGIGAAYAKPLRCGVRTARAFWRVPAHEFFAVALLPLLRDAARLRKPSGVTRITSFLRGFAAGWRTPIDRETLRYRLL